MKYYKVLKNDGSCVNGGSGKWHLPKRGKPGKWMPEIAGELELCANGYHICRPQDLVHWLDEAIFEVEFDGEIVEGDNKCVVRKARLVRKAKTWNERTARLFAADCAEHVLHIYEKQHPDDYRPRKTIQAARDFANGLISKKELAAARHAVLYEARDGVRFAVWSATRYEVWYAAWCAAWCAVMDAAQGVAWDAERKWQTNKLMEYLEE